MQEGVILLLLVEDSPVEAQLVRELLKSATGHPINITHVTSLKEGIAQLKIKAFNVVILDLTLPDSQGTDTFKEMQKNAEQTPIIVSSSLSDKALIYEVMQAGAQSYLVKGEYNSDTLINAINFAVWSYSK